MKRTQKNPIFPPAQNNGRGKAAAEEIRLRYLYRNLVLNGRARLKIESARGLVGPDCAFHLYGIQKVAEKRRKS